ncbi:DUF2190 family protein [Vibrio sp. OCN044]|uniref:DUF2190 family protein n=1 Tax=Vibrio tetraodonis subsp. pristinus TaxID=2695891 RepID=A0A6L8LZT2_9VIBR|nr:DUF2190 family protein [Vibrio tetraodonis]MYM61644.1 DUF2190 family protein [Vibrio tetraodonis subsp. pristinus]
MRKLYDGKSLTLKAPSGGVKKGELIKFGDMVLLPAESVKEGELFTGLFSGVYGNLSIDSGSTPKFQGEKAFLKNGTHDLTTAETGNDHCGYFVTTDGEQALMLQGLG